MAFYFGDSYGGSEATKQAAINSDNQLTLGLMAAQRAAMQMSLEQQNNAIQRQQSTVGLNAQLDQENADRALKEELGLGSLAASEDKIRTTEKTAAEKIAENDRLWSEKLLAAHTDKLDQVQQAGPVLADQFASLIDQNMRADQELQKANEDYLKTDQERAAKEGQGLIRLKKGTKDVFDATGGDKTAQVEADRITQELKAKTDAFNQAKARKAQAERDFEQHLRVIESSGFIPGNGAIVNPKLGLSFPIKLPQVQNSPKIKTYDPTTGTLK